MTEAMTRHGPPGPLDFIWRRLRPDQASRKAVEDLRLDADFLSALYNKLREVDPGEPASDTATICRHCIDVIDTTASLLGLLKQSEVSLSVKLLWSSPEGSEPVVHTVLRSTFTAASRENYRPADFFSYRANTAFKRLVEGRNSLRAFASNNLLELFARDEYETANERWWYYYVTTAVVPISDAQQGAMVGFVCADSPRAELDDPRVFAVLTVVSGYIYETLEKVFRRFEMSAGYSSESLKFGWKMQDSLPLPIQTEAQSMFQDIVSEIEAQYREQLNLVSGGGLLPLARVVPSPAEGRSMNESNGMIYEDDDEDPAAMELAKKLDNLSPEQEQRALDRMAKYNPEGAALFRKAISR